MPVAIITGSGGLIGSEAVDHFVSEGFDVVGHIFAQSEAQEYVEKAVRIERAILLG